MFCTIRAQVHYVERWCHTCICSCLNIMCMYVLTCRLMMLNHDSNQKQRHITTHCHEFVTCVITHCHELFTTHCHDVFFSCDDQQLVSCDEQSGV